MKTIVLQGSIWRLKKEFDSKHSPYREIKVHQILSPGLFWCDDVDNPETIRGQISLRVLENQYRQTGGPRPKPKPKPKPKPEPKIKIDTRSRLTMID